MAMNPMQKKARTSFLLGMFLTLVITGIIIGLLIFRLAQINKAQSEITYQKVFVLNQNVLSGDNIQGMGTLQDVETKLVPSNAIKATDIAQYVTEKSSAKIELRKGTILTTDMINKEGVETTSDVRLQEYNMVILPSQLQNGEFVDIRLRLPSGEDYIVLSRKYIEQTNNDTIWISVAEEEILTMSNAIVEAYIMEGSLLYATTYIDAGMQNAATPTYVATQEVINLMSADPNITTTAYNALAQRYNTESVRSQRAVINSAKNGYSNDDIINIEKNIADEIERKKAARQEFVDSLSVR